MSARRSTSWRLLASLLVAGCAAEPAETTPAPGPTGNYAPCDAGDIAFIRRLVPLMWGRHPAGSAEIELLRQVIARGGRENLVRVMARMPEYVERWRVALLDALQAPRLNERANAPCYGRGVQDGIDPSLAAWVRERSATDSAPAPFTMYDLMRSALVLDDLSPIYRLNLFSELQAEFKVPDGAGARAHGASRVQSFTKAYLNRKLECLGCHNSEFSITGNPDPALDRTWEIPGHFESALFGTASGVPVPALRTFFRRWGVVAGAFYDTDYNDGKAAEERAKAIRPFGLDASCGLFLPPELRREDDQYEDAYFAGPAPKSASVWELEGKLHAGFDALRGGLTRAADLSVDPDMAFAWLVSATIAENVWEEAFAAPLTLPNSFPRNRAQRDTLDALTTTFVSHGYSLVELLVAVTTRPEFNLSAPAFCEDPAAATLPALFLPFGAAGTPLPEIMNTVGDVVARLPSRTLLTAASYAMNWTMPSDYFVYYASPDAQRARLLGAFMKPTDAGYRGTNMQTLLTWESGFGFCEDPVDPTACAMDAIVASAQHLFGCSVCLDDPASVCAWDSRCCDLGWMASCPKDCVEKDRRIDLDFAHMPHPNPSPGPDFIDQLMTVATGGPLSDAVGALEDRLLGTAALTDAEERRLLADLAGVDLDTTVTAELEPALRRICGVYLLSADFQLGGLNDPTATAIRPNVTVPGTSFRERCEALRQAVFGDGASCSDTAITIR